MALLVQIGIWNAAAAAVLALVAAAVARLIRRPALTHTLWLLVLVKLVTPPFIPVSWPASTDEPPPRFAEALPASPIAIVEAAPDAGVEPVPEPVVDAELTLETPIVAEAESDPAVPPVAPVDWMAWAGAVWLAGLVLWLVWVAWHIVRFRRILRRAGRASGPLQRQADELARRLGLSRCPEVWLVPGAVSPMVWGVGFRPCLLFPAGLLDCLDATGRAALLAHELAHVRRRDHWVRLLELAATGLYWWHPALWWARRELHEAEEVCCDAWGVWATGGEARSYAGALLQAVAFVSQVPLPLPVGASGIGHMSHLKRRLAMIMQGTTSRSLSWTGLGVVVGLAVLLLPLFPAQGQPPAQYVPPDLPPRTDNGAVQDARADRDAQIEALKKTLQKLEEDKRREGARNDEKTQALRAELARLEATIAQKNKELADLTVKTHNLRTQLKELDAHPGYNTIYVPLVVPATKRPPTPPQDLEKKLDSIQKELDELRRALRPKAPPGGYPPPYRLDPNLRPSLPQPPGSSNTPAAPKPRQPDVVPIPPTTAQPPGNLAPGATPLYAPNNTTPPPTDTAPTPRR